MLVKNLKRSGKRSTAVTFIFYCYHVTNAEQDQQMFLKLLRNVHTFCVQVTGMYKERVCTSKGCVQVKGVYK